jgi:broad specificity phosphatase PhoE
MQLCVLARHGESAYNTQARLNGDPTVDVALTPDGRDEAHALGVYLAQAPLDLCIHTRFPRTKQTARLALAVGARRLPLVCEAALDDIDVGSWEGRPVADYHAWKQTHPRDEAPDGGESIRDAALRYARGLRSVSERPEPRVLVVCHELPLRYAVNAALGSPDIAGPEHAIAHATPYLFSVDALRDAAARIHAQALGAWGHMRPDAGAPVGERRGRRGVL